MNASGLSEYTEETEYLHGSKQPRAKSTDGPGTRDGRNETLMNGSRVLENGRVRRNDAPTINTKRRVRKDSHVHTDGSNVCR